MQKVKRQKDLLQPGLEQSLGEALRQVAAEEILPAVPHRFLAKAMMLGRNTPSRRGIWAWKREHV
jgi:hypothetical protein